MLRPHVVRGSSRSASSLQSSRTVLFVMRKCCRKASPVMAGVGVSFPLACEEPLEQHIVHVSAVSCSKTLSPTLVTCTRRINSQQISLHKTTCKKTSRNYHPACLCYTSPSTERKNMCSFIRYVSGAAPNDTGTSK